MTAADKNAADAAGSTVLELAALLSILHGYVTDRPEYFPDHITEALSACERIARGAVEQLNALTN